MGEGAHIHVEITFFFLLIFFNLQVSHDDALL